MMRLAAGKKRRLLASMARLLHQSVSENPSSLQHSFVPTRSISLSSDYRMLLQSLRGCQLRPNMRTVTGIHARVIKCGYAMHSSVMSFLVLQYLSCDHLSGANELLKEVQFWNLNLVSANLIISCLMKHGEISVAKKVFEAIPDRDVVMWNTMIGGCVKNAYFKEAFTFFRKMLRCNVEPDAFTFASMFKGCAKVGAVHHAKWVHGLFLEKKIELNHILSAALIDMYSKCGRIEMAKEVFDAVQRDEVSVWNTMITGLASHGLAQDAIATFSLMEREKCQPDSITFLAILTACSHCGLTGEAHNYFQLMRKQYMIDPQLEHYGAMVDLLGRAGQLEEAYCMIRDMPMEPDVVVWRIFLSACRTHKKSELGEVAAMNISHLGSGDYVLLSNTYCSVQNWNTAEKLRHNMRMKGIRKSKGKSWLEFGDTIHQFMSGDRSHPETEGIYKVLEGLIKRTRKEGFNPTTELVLMDISEEEKEENLAYHSEKLAFAYGILKSGPGVEIHVSKNLRICADCHSWFKIASKLLNRSIIIRDRIRFHRFERGLCSCGDYW